MKRLGIGNKLYKALIKESDLPRVIFIDVNVPDVVMSDEPEGWVRAALDQLREKEKRLTIKGEPAPSAYVFITNHPYHHNLAGLDTGYAVVADSFKIPDFGADARFTKFKDLLASRERHKEMIDLCNSLGTHYEIPSTFDGEMPELAFGDGKDVSRLKIGSWYQIPDEQGNEVLGQLTEAIIVEDWKECVGVYRLKDGRHLTAKCPVSDGEVAAYKKSPDTFFGVYRPERRRRELKTVVDAFDFCYESYQHTPKERLLEFMANCPDIDRLKELSQEELAVTYCEGMAHSMMRQADEKKIDEGPDT